MEPILTKLLVADNKVIQEGTKELKEAFKDPNAIPALCDVVVTSVNPQIRQSAAVLLRRKLGKKRFWNKLNLDTRIRIKDGMLRALVNEKEKLVKNSIAQFIGLLGKFEFADNSWPELLQFIYTLCSSESIFDKELGMYALSIMTEISQGSYIPHAEHLITLFTTMLNSLQEPVSNLSYYTIVTMKNLVVVMGGHQKMINAYHNLLPTVLQIIHAFSPEDEKRAVDIFEILEELIEFAVNAIVPHIKSVVDMCLQIGGNNNMPTLVQIKAISIVGWLVRSKGKVIQKHKLVEPIIDVLMRLMAQQPTDDTHEEYFVGDPDQFTTITIATQTLDLIALHLPAEKVVSYILTQIEPAVQSNDIYAQKAAYLCLAVLAEGCADCIRHKYLESFLKCVCAALHHQNSIVRNAAFFALGQFSEHLQPEVSQYASELLPVLFDYLKQIFVQMEREKSEPNSLEKLFYALETFCENLEEGLMPYIPQLMERLMVGLDPNNWSKQLKRLSLSCLGSATSAVQSGMVPYFPKVIEILHIYISADASSELHELQSDAIDCLAIFVQFIGEDRFKPLESETLEMALRIMNNTDDPDIRRSIYALLGSLAIVMKGNMAPVLDKIVQQMILSIQSSEGIVSYYSDDKKDDIDVYGEVTDSDEEIDEDLGSTDSESTDDCRYAIENAYNEEKEQACVTLKELCANMGHLFLPYIEKSFEEIYKLIDYPQEHIRKSAMESLLQFCITLHQVNTEQTKQALYKCLQSLIPKCAQIIRTDEEISVVIEGLETFTKLLQNVGKDAIVGEGHREAIMNCVIDVLNLKTLCQDTDLNADVGNPNDDNTEAEHDELLLECACDVIPKFGSVLEPSDFVMYFQNILDLLLPKTMKKSSITQRSFGFGTLAECMKCLDVYVEKFVPQLLQLWLTGAKDEADEVRNNSMFGLGEMILHGKDRIFSYYGGILQALSTAVSREAHASTLDNICGALAKMIIVNSEQIPLDQVFPVFLQHLPLKDDFQENEAVIKSFFVLYQKGSAVLKQHLDVIIKILAHIYHKKQAPNEGTESLLGELIKTIAKDFPSELQQVIQIMDTDQAQSLQILFVS